MRNTTFSVSNTLILISAIFTISAMIYPDIYRYGMNRDFFDQGRYGIWIAQFFTSEFLHGGILHFVMNSVFIYYFGNSLERYTGHWLMFVFFFTYSIFQGVMITYFGHGNTIGISGFAMALLTYYTLMLWRRKNPEYKGGLTAIALNIVIGFVPGISLLGHSLGVLYGVIFYLFSPKK